MGNSMSKELRLLDVDLTSNKTKVNRTRDGKVRHAATTPSEDPTRPEAFIVSKNVGSETTKQLLLAAPSSVISSIVRTLSRTFIGPILACGTRSASGVFLPGSRLYSKISSRPATEIYPRLGQGENPSKNSAAALLMEATRSVIQLSVKDVCNRLK